jgi:hypothetical protein
MTSRNFAFVTGALICMLSVPAISQISSDWVDIKDPNELRALHSNKTFKAKGKSFLAHYRSDGKALVIEDNRRISRTWEVKRNDQVCYTDERFMGCRQFRRHKENRDEISIQHVSEGWSVIMMVEDGIPQF